MILLVANKTGIAIRKSIVSTIDQLCPFCIQITNIFKESPDLTIPPVVDNILHVIKILSIIQ